MEPTPAQFPTKSTNAPVSGTNPSMGKPSAPSLPIEGY